MMALNWKTSWTGKECRIFREKLIVGLLKTKMWNGIAHGELFGHMLAFKPEGFFRRSTEILDINQTIVLGKIEYNWWKSSATITYQNQVFNWKFNSWTRKSWVVSSNATSGYFKRTSVWKNEGTIEQEDLPAPIVLAALYVQAHFLRMTGAAS